MKLTSIHIAAIALLDHNEYMTPKQISIALGIEDVPNYCMKLLNELHALQLVRPDADNEMYWTISAAGMQIIYDATQLPFDEKWLLTQYGPIEAGNRP